MGDLIEYNNSKLKFANRGFGFILILIDVFTKMVYTRPLKRKDKFSVALAMQSILQDLPHFPNTLITDEGLEFYNKNVKNVLNKYSIHHYSIKSPMKASVVERVIRTLKSKLEKFFSFNKSKNWVDILDQFVTNYNNTPHRSIKMPPSKVKDSNADIVFHNLYPDLTLASKPRLKIGNIVRILKDKTIFDKGYKQSWSDSLYRIYKVKQVAGVVWYLVEDLTGKRSPGIHYYWKLNFVAKNDNKLLFERST